ncbi:MAG: hypothetical protein A2070_08665 [Bdellovibrionales bacterium GWC1_52_8]|nr:MAG: hypothetical protein A2Z97_12305 [Bdellovibrionales bacterium GWB1_52_6]OFZ03724.1 MAG: hypothetical protein A2X97_14285 [Bdellovibrionales bacterium GWA1_52_35]OFZ41127.1 MAG: hypothetical protein A2070_08665 [Bdellovibrionales bacterium GWC1_52_8]
MTADSFGILILAEPPAQVLGLADIDETPLGIENPVNTGARRQKAQEILSELPIKDFQSILS